MTKLLTSFIVIGVLTVGVIGCNNPEQNFSFRPGDSLRIVGPTSLTLKPDLSTTDTTDRLPAHGIYYTKYATIKKTYQWSVSGSATIDSTFRYEDLHVAISFPEVGTVTIKVNDGEYAGTIDVTVTR